MLSWQLSTRLALQYYYGGQFIQNNNPLSQFIWKFKLILLYGIVLDKWRFNLRNKLFKNKIEWQNLGKYSFFDEFYRYYRTSVVR